MSLETGKIFHCPFDDDFQDDVGATFLGNIGVTLDTDDKKLGVASANFGGNDYLRYTNPIIALSGDQTISFWAHSSASFQSMFSTRYDNRGSTLSWIDFKSNGVEMGGPYYWKSFTFASGWHMYTILRNGTTNVIVRDKIVMAKFTASTSWQGGAELLLGRRWTGGITPQYLIGNEDDPRIYNRALSYGDVEEGEKCTGEIAELYALAVPEIAFNSYYNNMLAGG